ncbi:hypothetical protein A2U01_0083865, partial [Trifolium medium]|nr:hypothetical protein [Trifolium medium]
MARVLAKYTLTDSPSPIARISNSQRNDCNCARFTFVEP